MRDEFQHWRDALAGRPVEIHADVPQPGYYKVRAGKDGPWLPVAIWRKDGAVVCRVGGETRDPAEVWTWAAKHPVAKDAAKQAFATGQWPGDVGIGHNSGDLTLADEITEARPPDAPSSSTSSNSGPSSSWWICRDTGLRMSRATSMRHCTISSSAIWKKPDRLPARSS
jgi:hypothetical protein